MALSTNPASHTSSPIILGFDNAYVGIGASGATDSYITFDGTNLIFYDSTVGAAKTLTQLVSGGGVSTLDEAFDGGQAINGATTEGTAVQLGGATDYISIWQQGANDVRIDTSSGAVLNLDAAGGYINILSDSTKLGFGASGGTTDAYIYFNGTDLIFYSSALGTTATLKDIASGTLVDLGVTSSLTVTANSATTGDVVTATSSSLTSGTAFKASTIDATMTTGYYFEAYNGATTVFGVKRYGEIEITGSAAADMITVTAGNLQLDNGKFEVDTTQDVTSYVKRNNATGTAAAFEVEQSNATGGTAVTIDQDATGDVDAVSIENAGTGFAVTATGGVAGSRGYEFISATSGTGSGFLADGTTGGASWVGAAGTGLIQAQSDGALADVAASLLYLAYSGNAAGANQTGSCINVVETGTASGTSYAVGVSSTNNNGMKISVGAVSKTNLLLNGVASQTASQLIVDGVTNNWIGAATTGMVHLKSDGALANATSSLLYSTFTGNTGAIVPSGSCAYFYENGTIAAGGYAVGIAATGGHGLKIATAGTGYNGLTCTCAASATASIIYVDGATADWIGAATTGMVHLTSDGAIVADGSLLRIASSGQPAAANDGVCLEIVESGAARATSYAMRITSTSNEALHVDAGICLFDELIVVENGANVDVGGAVAARATPPTNAINLTNGTAPVGALANVVTLYAAAGELRVMDAGGNSTLLSPHDDEGFWVFDSKDTTTGRHLRIDVERMLTALAEKDASLKKFISIT
jgi:hypothetical protein